MELVNQAKKMYMHNSKEDHIYFGDRFSLLQDNQIYQHFIGDKNLLSSLKTFAEKADIYLEQFYSYNTDFEELFSNIFGMVNQEFSELAEFQNLIEYCKYLSEFGFGSQYTCVEAQLHLRSLINFTKIYHDVFLLNSFSTLSDVESIFVLPYRIDRQKYDFEDSLKEILAQSIYYYQLTLASVKEIPDSTQKIIEDLKGLEKDLKANIGRMPENYESQRGKVKQLLIKLKEVYRDNIHNEGISTLADNIFKHIRNSGELNLDEAHHKLRSISSVCVSLYRTFYKEFGYLIGPFILTLLNVINDLTSTLLSVERLSHSKHSQKLHKKILNYPEISENPLSMLKYANSRAQIDSIIHSMHNQVQDLVKLEVGARRDKDLKEAEREDLKGIFKIPITPQLEHLMKISKSIFDKTEKDKRMEEEQEIKEINQNFPKYTEEFDMDRIFNKEEEQNADYEEPIEEPDIMNFNSFRNMDEKKKCFYKLLKTYKALLTKKNSILSKNTLITTVSESGILTEKFLEISSLFQNMLSRQSQDKLEGSLTRAEQKILYLKIKK